MATSQSETVYVGYTTKPVSGWEKFVPVPQAPSNYKDPEKIADAVKKAMEKQKETAKDNVLTGEFDELCITIKANDKLVPVTGWPDKTALELLQPFKKLFCFHATTFCRLAVMEHLDRYPKTPLNHDLIWVSDIPVPALALGSMKAAFNPIKLLLGTSDADYKLVAARMGLALPTVGKEADKMTVAVCNLATLLNL